MYYLLFVLRDNMRTIIALLIILIPSLAHAQTQAIRYDFDNVNLVEAQVTRFEMAINNTIINLGLTATVSDPDTLIGHSTREAVLPTLATGGYDILIRACSNTLCGNPASLPITCDGTNCVMGKVPNPIAILAPQRLNLVSLGGNNQVTPFGMYVCFKTCINQVSEIRENLTTTWTISPQAEVLRNGIYWNRTDVMKIGWRIVFGVPSISIQDSTGMWQTWETSGSRWVSMGLTEPGTQQ